MIFILSLIICFGGVVTTLIFTILNKMAWYYCILLPFGYLILSVGFFCLLVMALLLILGKHFSKTYNPKGKVRWAFMKDVARFSCFWLGVIPIVKGLEKIPLDKTIVIYSNHQSYLDMFILYIVLRKFPHATMYKKIIETYPLAKGMAKALGGISIDREDDKEALKVVINIINEVKKGVNFLIFPEGTRSKGIYMHPFKAGSFKIVQKSEANCVLIAIDGAYKKIMTFPFIPTPIYVNVVKVLTPDDYQSLNTQEFALMAHDIIENDINEARKKHIFLKPNKKLIKK